MVINAYERGLVDEWPAECNEKRPSSGHTANLFYGVQQTLNSSAKSLHWVFLSVKDETSCSLRVLNGVGIIPVNMELVALFKQH